MHLLLSKSDRERDIEQLNKPKDPLLELKASILFIFQKISQDPKARTFGLHSSTIGIYMVFFVNHVRVDSVFNAVVADIVLLPLSEERLKIYGKDLAEEKLDDKMVIISTPPPEALLWQHLLPALTERCRTWSHRPSCEYQLARKVPLSTELGCISLCTCGEGKDLGAFSNLPDRSSKTFAPYATRAALSPLFAVSFLEPVGGFLREAMAKIDSTVGSAATKTCAQCGTGAVGKRTLLLCSVCKDVRYCGRACQVAHWKKHKNDCQVNN